MAGRIPLVMSILLGVLLTPAHAAAAQPLNQIPAISVESDASILEDSAKTSEDKSLPGDTLDSASDTLQTEIDARVGDTVILVPTPYVASEDTSVINAYLSENYTPAPKRSPSITMLKSVAFPGWGQFSNKKYFKAGVIFAIESYFIYKAVDFGIKASDSRKYWKSLPDSQATEKAEAFRLYTNDRDNRNSNIWYSVIVTFLSMIDAYVDAHLQDFPEKDKQPGNISFDVAPGAETRVAVTLRF